MTANKPLTTAQVPPEFLKTTFLVGHVPQRALASDPRVSYSLYIPPKLYRSDPHASTQTADQRLPLVVNVHGTVDGRLPLLVHVHGTGRNLAAMHGDLVSFAEAARCAVVAPLFPAGLDGPNDLDSYKLLRSSTLRSDLAVLSMLDEIAYRWPGIQTEKVFMMGFSGGGQFVHRFLYLYPERLSAVSVGAPGRVTFLDENKNWPLGVSNVGDLFDRIIKKDLIRQVKVQFVVGSKDDEVFGGKAFWDWLRGVKKQLGEESSDKLPSMEQGRLQTLRGLQEAFKEDQIDVSFDVVDGASHNADQVRECVLGYLRPLIH